MNTILLEVALLVLTLAMFWALDRYAIGCDRL